MSLLFLFLIQPAFAGPLELPTELRNLLGILNPTSWEKSCRTTRNDLKAYVFPNTIKAVQYLRKQIDGDVDFSKSKLRSNGVYQILLICHATLEQLQPYSSIPEVGHILPQLEKIAQKAASNIVARVEATAGRPDVLEYFADSRVQKYLASSEVSRIRELFGLPNSMLGHQSYRWSPYLQSEPQEKAALEELAKRLKVDLTRDFPDLQKLSPRELRLALEYEFKGYPFEYDYLNRVVNTQTLTLDQLEQIRTLAERHPTRETPYRAYLLASLYAHPLLNNTWTAEQAAQIREMVERTQEISSDQNRALSLLKLPLLSLEDAHLKRRGLYEKAIAKGNIILARNLTSPVQLLRELVDQEFNAKGDKGHNFLARFNVQSAANSMWIAHSQQSIPFLIAVSQALEARSEPEFEKNLLEKTKEYFKSDWNLIQVIAAIETSQLTRLKRAAQECENPPQRKFRRVDDPISCEQLPTNAHP